MAPQQPRHFDAFTVVLVTSLFCTTQTSFLRPHPASQTGPVGGFLDVQEQAVLKRMQWWFAGAPEKPLSDRYLLFSMDAGGLNNIRIGWEMTGLVAQYTGRTLVLPPAQPVYLLDWGDRLTGFLPESMSSGEHKTAVDDMLNVKQLKTMLPTLTWDEFHKRTGLTWEAARQEAMMVDAGKAQDCHGLSDYEASNSRLLFMSGDGDRREGFSCGEWYKRGGPTQALKEKVGDKGYALLTHGFMWHEDAFHIASKVVSYLGLFKYVALHARYNDFTVNFGQQPAPQDVVDELSPWLGSGTTLYIASDEPQKFAGLNMHAARVVMWADLLGPATNGLLSKERERYSEERWFKLTGPVEELICTFSKVFLGSDKSSFTGHIQAMRIQAEAPVTSMILNTNPLPKDDVLSELARWDGKGGAGAFSPLPRDKGNVIFLQVEED